MHGKEKATMAKGPQWIRQDGRLWFTREAERQFYFILTVIMLILGILYKIGVL
jgi:hypothetical protein